MASRVSSFDPKLGWRLQAAENLHYSLSFRGMASAQDPERPRLPPPPIGSGPPVPGEHPGRPLAAPA